MSHFWDLIHWIWLKSYVSLSGSKGLSVNVNVNVNFLRFSKRKGVADSDLYYFKDKGSVKITSKLEALGRTLLSGAIGWILTKFVYFTSISGPHVAPKENSLKKIYRNEFLQSSFIFVIYLLKEVYRKIMSEIHFVGKTRYEDLTETGS